MDTSARLMGVMKLVKIEDVGKNNVDDLLKRGVK